jgi:hypothetical protein
VAKNINRRGRPLEVRVELRPNSHENKKNFEGRVDSWAIVESRTGMVLRWIVESEAAAERVAAKIRKEGKV